MLLGRAITFDTKRNRLVLKNIQGDPPADGFLFYYPDTGTWQASGAVNAARRSTSSLTYSAATDTYFAMETGAKGAVKLDQYDPTGLFKGQMELSQFISCGQLACQLAASGDRLVLIAPPTGDLYEPLLPAVQRSYLIDPTNGNVTILGALPEPGGILILSFIAITMSRRTTAAHPRPLP